MSKVTAESRSTGKATPIQLVTVPKYEDDFASEVLDGVFPRDGDQQDGLLQEASADGALKKLTVFNLGDYLDSRVDNAAMSASSTDEGSGQGRLGPADVMFHFDNIGTLVIDQDQLELSSQSNFSSIKANTCVFKGKWMYEVMLGSKGVMQVGWCTLKCKFSQEEGVGDTENSYAYDGSRQRKWNKTTQKYGDAWCTGDVITCTIDCEAESISFYRNGKSLGEAFSSVRFGPGYAYFPAVSLSLGESLRANFGATPLKYPVDGFRPLQSAPCEDVRKSNLLLNYMEKLIDISNNINVTEADERTKKLNDCDETKPPPLTDKRSKQSSLLLIVCQVMDKLSPLLRCPYVAEACLLKMLVRLNDVTVVNNEQPSISRLLDYMWAFMLGSDVRCCVKNLMMSLLQAYRYAPATTDFRHNRQYLTLVLAILRHQQTRRYLLSSELFDKIKFPMFLHIKPLDDAGLQELTPTVWWDMSSQDEEESTEQPNLSPDDEDRKNKYLKSCDELRQKIEEIEHLQVTILKVLLNHTDLINGQTSRQMFLEKFRKYIKETKLTTLNLWPLPVTLCFFHRMVQALRYYWDDFQKEDTSRFVLSSEAYMPIQEFWSDTRDYFDLQRCGGSMSHLNRILGSEVNKAQGLEVSDEGQVKMVSTPESEYPKPEMPSGNTLMEMLDGVMLMYYTAAHKQLGKMNVLKEHIQEYVQSYSDTLRKLETCPIEMNDVRDELTRAKSVFLEKITELSRQICWVRAVTYSKQKQLDVAWLLKAALKTVRKASEYKLLFQYMPEFYLDIVVYSYNALKNFFHSSEPFNSLSDYDELMKGFASFLVCHFSDSRIVIADSRDNIIQALACFTCYEKSLKVLESLPLDMCTRMLKALVAPYESRSWAQTNWILVRIWKGCGFGFRYTLLPHLVPSKVQLTEFGSASLQKPCPSPKFQSLLADILNTEPDIATRFLDTLLQQLNWSFSEFISMLQDIQTLMSRTERRVLIESRQLKICGTCFEISICLFRVVEMVVCIAPKIFTDWTRPSAELLLTRLIQLICLVLNRITQKNGMFDTVASFYITGLESVTYYPMLSVIAGILVTLLGNADPESQSKVTRIMLSDHGFQLSGIEFLLGNHSNPDTSSPVATATASTKGIKEKQFNFRNYEEVSSEEIASVERLLAYLSGKQTAFVRQDSEILEDDLCQICYAHRKTSQFKPCGHSSCRSCINHQMLIKKECFFCKAIITSIEDLTIDAGLLNT